MDFHANHALGLPQRLALVVAIERGGSLRAAAALSVAPATAPRWWHRWLEASPGERRSRSCLRDRSSRPRRSPRQLTEAEEAPILRGRRETNLRPGRLAGLVRRARSTVWKVLDCHGLARRPRGERQSFRRYEWSRPGALLPMDVKRLSRFGAPVTAPRAVERATGALEAPALTTCTASSTTTPASPTSSCTERTPSKPTSPRSGERSPSSPSRASRRPRP
jgi:hypothetical protein